MKNIFNAYSEGIGEGVERKLDGHRLIVSKGPVRIDPFKFRK